MATVSDPYPGTQFRTTRQSPFSAFVDVGLLFVVCLTSSDALGHLGPVQSLTWLMCYTITLIRVFVLWPYVFEMLVRNRILFAYPLTCLASVLWSHAPSNTLISAIQLNMTFLIASYLGWRYSMDLIVKSVAIVLSITMGLSLLHWATGVFPWKVYTNAGGLVGVFSHKNMLGQRALFCILTLFVVFLMPRHLASRLFKAASFLGLAITLITLLLSRSMTAVLLMLPMLGLLAILCRRYLPGRLFVSASIVIVLMVAVAPLGFSVAGVDPVQVVLDAVGKDATLTGRTELWHVAFQVSGDYPVLGVGYTAFWFSPEFAHERLLTQHAGATTSVSFHNFVLEILVGCGWIGVLAILAIIATCVRRLAILFANHRSVSAAAGLTIVVTVVVTSLLGPSFYRGHEFMIVLVVMFAVSSKEDLRLRLTTGTSTFASYPSYVKSSLPVFHHAQFSPSTFYYSRSS